MPAALRSFVLQLGILGLIALVTATASEPDIRTSIQYDTREIRGWNVRIQNSLLAEGSVEKTNRAIELLTSQLDEIIRVVPAIAVVELKKAPLWISPTYPDTQPRAEYHPNVRWLKANGRDPAMAKGIEFTNVSIFEAEVERMPVFVLHELAHAFHDRVLSFDHPEVIAAFKEAKSRKSYDAVERQGVNGRPSRVERAYAMTDHKEYFAETTEAFFGRNDFFPFTREDLQRHDPEMERLLDRLWNSGRPAAQ